MSELLARVSCRSFVAGLVLVDDICTVAAPILASRRTLGAIGCSRDWIRTECQRRGWKIEVVPTVAERAAREAGKQEQPPKGTHP